MILFNESYVSFHLYHSLFNFSKSIFLLIVSLTKNNPKTFLENNGMLVAEIFQGTFTEKLENHSFSRTHFTH